MNPLAEYEPIKISIFIRKIAIEQVRNLRNQWHDVHYESPAGD